MRKMPEIKVESFVYVNGVKTNTKDLNPEQKEYLGNWITVQAMNAQFRGRAVFEAKLKDGTIIK